MTKQSPPIGRKQAEGHRNVLKDLETKEDHLRDMFVDGLLDKEGYNRGITQFRKERDHYNYQLETLNVAISDANHVAVKRVLELAINAKSLFKIMSKEEKLEYLKMVYSNPTLDKLSLEYQL